MAGPCSGAHQGRSCRAASHPGLQQGCFLPWGSTWLSSLLNFPKFFSSHFSSLLGSLRKAALPSTISAGPSLLGVICRPDEHVLHCLFQGTDKNIKQDRSQARPLQYSTSSWPGSWTSLLRGHYSHGCHPLSRPQPALPCQWTADAGEHRPAWPAQYQYQEVLPDAFRNLDRSCPVMMPFQQLSGNLESCTMKIFNHFS